jgi:hypothetical protein
VDDLEKEEALEVYEDFGFEEKEHIWDYIGGKFGNILSLFEEKKRGYSEKEALETLLRDSVAKLEWLFSLLEEGEKEGPPIEEVFSLLKKFKDEEKLPYREVKGRVLRFLIEENILFYNPLEGSVRPQGRLLLNALRKVL